MSYNIFGHLFRFSTFGESHGPAIGCVVDGCPPGLVINRHDIQAELNRRRPGTSKFVTQRKEPDEVEILSGVFENSDGQTVSTGTPIGLLIRNVDQRSKDYGEIATTYRPGHADFTYVEKYGIRDYRGGGRSSARETAMRVAAGAIAKQVIAPMRVRAALVQVGTRYVDRARWDWDHVSQSQFFCPDPGAEAEWADYLGAVRKAGSSVGAVIEVVAEHVPVGLGAPIYGKLDADLASAMMSINAVKGVEIGDGMAVAGLTGEDNADEMRIDSDGSVQFEANHAGGVLGGISTGQPLVCRFAVKPTSSILTPRRTINEAGAETEIVTKGRHDPCVGIRAVPVGEAMMALVLADHLLRHRGQVGGRADVNANG
ncbi:MAG: chorismate synthase [Pseudomonadota bacterium]